MQHIAITDLLSRIPRSPATGSEEASPHAQAEGLLLHNVAEAYLKGDSLDQVLDLLVTAPGLADQQEHLRQMGLALLSYLNRTFKGAPVEAEVPLSLTIGDFTLHGRADCIQRRPQGLHLYDWKPAPRPDGLDRLQIGLYLAAALTAAGQTEGDWTIYYYSIGRQVRGHAKLSDLMPIVHSAIAQALPS
jgi:hypothetical protein